MVDKWGPRYKRHKGRGYEEVAYFNGYNDGLARANKIIKKNTKPKQWKH